MDNSYQHIPQELKDRPTKITVSLTALRHNLAVLRQQAGGAKILASVKADAYGHGLVPCCQVFEEEGVDYLGVAFVEEGILLRKNGITAPILVFGGLSDSQIGSMLTNDLEITASSVHKLKAINQEARRREVRARVHLKIDTGMERIGVHYYSAEDLLKVGQEASHCDIVGVYSHFASADSQDLTFARIQLNRFKEVVQFFPRNGLAMPLLHMANSGALLQLEESHFDMVRPGICLYGAYPERHLQGMLDLQPVMRLTSHIVYFKVVKKDAPVSYGGTWRAASDTRIVTIPIGYGDGFSRANSNVGSVLIRGIRYPIVGAVCMDQLMVNIGAGEAYNGDEVVLIGCQGSEQITVEDIAESIGTIPYEILTALKSRIPRVYESA